MSEKFLISPRIHLESLNDKMQSILNNYPKEDITLDLLESFYDQFQEVFDGEYRSMFFQIALLHQCTMKFFECVIVFLKRKVPVTEVAIDKIKVWMEILVNIANADGITDKFQFLTAIIQNPYLNDMPLWFRKEIFRNLTRIFKTVPEVIVDNDQDSLKFLYLALAKWLKMLLTCGDYECQVILTELILNTCKEELLTEILDNILQVPEDIKIGLLKVYRLQNYFYDLRLFLNSINDCFKYVHCIPCLSVTLEEIIIPTTRDNNCLWMQVNMGAKTLSFSCSRYSLRSLPISESDSMVEDEMVTVHFEHVNKICALYKEDPNISAGGIFLMYVTGPCSCLFKSSKEIVLTIKKIKFVVPKGEHFQIIKKKFPLIFEKKFKAQTDLLAIDVKRRNSVDNSSSLSFCSMPQKDRKIRKKKFERETNSSILVNKVESCIENELSSVKKKGISKVKGKGAIRRSQRRHKENSKTETVSSELINFKRYNFRPSTSSRSRNLMFLNSPDVEILCVDKNERNNQNASGVNDFHSSVNEKDSLEIRSMNTDEDFEAKSKELNTSFEKINTNRSFILQNTEDIIKNEHFQSETFSECLQNITGVTKFHNNYTLENIEKVESEDENVSEQSSYQKENNCTKELGLKIDDCVTPDLSKSNKTPKSNTPKAYTIEELIAMNTEDIFNAEGASREETGFEAFVEGSEYYSTVSITDNSETPDLCFDRSSEKSSKMHKLNHLIKEFDIEIVNNGECANEDIQIDVSETPDLDFNFENNTILNLQINSREKINTNIQNQEEETGNSILCQQESKYSVDSSTISTSNIKPCGTSNVVTPKQRFSKHKKSKKKLTRSIEIHDCSKPKDTNSSFNEINKDNLMMEEESEYFSMVSNYSKSNQTSNNFEIQKLDCVSIEKITEFRNKDCNYNIQQFSKQNKRESPEKSDIVNVNLSTETIIITDDCDLSDNILEVSEQNSTNMNSQLNNKIQTNKIKTKEIGNSKLSLREDEYLVDPEIALTSDVGGFSDICELRKQSFNSNSNFIKPNEKKNNNTTFKKAFKHHDSSRLEDTELFFNEKNKHDLIAPEEESEYFSLLPNYPECNQMNDNFEMPERDCILDQNNRKLKDVNKDCYIIEQFAKPNKHESQENDDSITNIRFSTNTVVLDDFSYSNSILKEIIVGEKKEDTDNDNVSIISVSSSIEEVEDDFDLKYYCDKKESFEEKVNLNEEINRSILNIDTDKMPKLTKIVENNQFNKRQFCFDKSMEKINTVAFKENHITEVDTDDKLQRKSLTLIKEINIESYNVKKDYLVQKKGEGIKNIKNKKNKKLIKTNKVEKIARKDYSSFFNKSNNEDQLFTNNSVIKSTIKKTERNEDIEKTQSFEIIKNGYSPVTLGGKNKDEQDEDNMSVISISSIEEDIKFYDVKEEVCINDKFKSSTCSSLNKDTKTICYSSPSDKSVEKIRNEKLKNIFDVEFEDEKMLTSEINKFTTINSSSMIVKEQEDDNVSVISISSIEYDSDADLHKKQRSCKDKIYSLDTDTQEKINILTKNDYFAFNKSPKKNENENIINDISMEIEIVTLEINEDEHKTETSKINELKRIDDDNLRENTIISNNEYSSNAEFYSTVISKLEKNKDKTLDTAAEKTLQSNTKGSNQFFYLSGKVSKENEPIRNKIILKEVEDVISNGELELIVDEKKMTTHESVRDNEYEVKGNDHLSFFDKLSQKNDNEEIKNNCNTIEMEIYEQSSKVSEVNKDFAEIDLSELFDKDTQENEYVTNEYFGNKVEIDDLGVDEPEITDNSFKNDLGNALENEHEVEKEDKTNNKLTLDTAAEKTLQSKTKGSNQFSYLSGKVSKENEPIRNKIILKEVEDGISNGELELIVDEKKMTTHESVRDNEYEVKGNDHLSFFDKLSQKNDNEEIKNNCNTIEMEIYEQSSKVSEVNKDFAEIDLSELFDKDTQENEYVTNEYFGNKVEIDDLGVDEPEITDNSFKNDLGNALENEHEVEREDKTNNKLTTSKSGEFNTDDLGFGLSQIADVPMLLDRIHFESQNHDENLKSDTAELKKTNSNVSLTYIFDKQGSSKKTTNVDDLENSFSTIKNKIMEDERKEFSNDKEDMSSASSKVNIISNVQIAPPNKTNSSEKRTNCDFKVNVVVLNKNLQSPESDYTSTDESTFQKSRTKYQSSIVADVQARGIDFEENVDSFYTSAQESFHNKLSPEKVGNNKIMEISNDKYCFHKLDSTLTPKRKYALPEKKLKKETKPNTRQIETLFDPTVETNNRKYSKNYVQTYKENNFSDELEIQRKRKFLENKFGKHQNDSCNFDIAISEQLPSKKICSRNKKNNFSKKVAYDHRNFSSLQSQTPLLRNPDICNYDKKRKLLMQSDHNNKKSNIIDIKLYQEIQRQADKEFKIVEDNSLYKLKRKSSMYEKQIECSFAKESRNKHSNLRQEEFSKIIEKNYGFDKMLDCFANYLQNLKPLNANIQKQHKITKSQFGKKKANKSKNYGQLF